MQYLEGLNFCVILFSTQGIFLTESTESAYYYSEAEINISFPYRNNSKHTAELAPLPLLPDKSVSPIFSLLFLYIFP